MTDFDEADIRAMRKQGDLRAFLRGQIATTAAPAPPPPRPVLRPPGWIPGQWPPGTRPPSRADVDPAEAAAVLAEMRRQERERLNGTTNEEL